MSKKKMELFDLEIDGKKFKQIVKKDKLGNIVWDKFQPKTPGIDVGIHYIKGKSENHFDIYVDGKTKAHIPDKRLKPAGVGMIFRNGRWEYATLPQIFIDRPMDDTEKAHEYARRVKYKNTNK